MTKDELRLTALLRQIDQLIFRMGQCSSWSQMLPLFQELHEGTMSRMNEESNRIRMLLVPEIVRTYAKPTEANPPTHGYPRLEGPADASGVAPMGQLDSKDNSSRGPSRGGPTDDD